MYIVNRFGKEVNKIWLNEDFVSLTPSVYKNYLVFSTFKGYLYCWSLNEPKEPQEFWRVKIGKPSTSIPIIENGTVFVSFSNAVYSLNLSDGKILWKFKGKEEEEFKGLSVSGDSVIITSSSNRVFSLNKERGNLLWSKNMPEPSYKLEKVGVTGIITNPLSIGDSVFITSSDGKFYRLNLSNGDIIKAFETDTQRTIFVSPSLAKNRITFGTLGGVVYCFQLVEK